MESNRIILALKALAHPHRLALYRLLVQAGQQGVTVGILQDQTGHAAASLSNHLNGLRRAGLVSDRRVGRNIWCRADYARMNALIGFLTENCCTGLSCAVDQNRCVAASPSRKSKRTRS